MPHRYPRSRWPAAWLFAEPRIADLPATLARLPRGAGIVFGFIGLGPTERARMFRQLAITARRRQQLVIDARDSRIAKAHDRVELVAARRRGAKLIFVSPVFPTRSHPGAPSLGRLRFGLLIRGARIPVAALGGMTAARFQTLRPLGAVAWGAIDAWST